MKIKAFITGSLTFAITLSLLTLAGCSRPIQEEQDALSVEDKAPASSITELHNNCAEIDCGVSAASIFLKCYGIQIYPSALGSDRDIFDVLKDHVDYSFLWEWQDVEEKITSGAPVILKLYHEPQFTSEEKITEATYLNSHWVVAYDIREDTVYLSDPMFGYTTSTIDKIEDSWSKCGKFAITV